MPLLPKKQKTINVCVTTLEAALDFAVKSSINGKRLLDHVARTIGLREVWYFGLQYRNKDGDETWLNLDKKISSIDTEKTASLEFEFLAKFFPEDATKELIQEITQRLFFLQVKEAILKDKLPCPAETAVLLASYACQAKYGDYDERRFTQHPIPIDKLLSPNTLVSHDLQSQDWVQMVIRSYIEHRGMYPQVAMLHYLEIAEGLETYGVDFFQICNRRGTSLLLGIDSMGLAIYKPQNKISPKVGFPWSEIRNISFNDRKFTIKPIDKSSKDLVFYTKNLKSNKKILALCIGNNELYVRRRLPESIEMQQMRSQAHEETLYRELERERLEKERAARIEAERRVRELEALLEQAQMRLLGTESGPASPLRSSNRRTSAHNGALKHEALPSLLVSGPEANKTVGINGNPRAMTSSAFQAVDQTTSLDDHSTESRETMPQPARRRSSPPRIQTPPATSSSSSSSSSVRKASHVKRKKDAGWRSRPRRQSSPLPPHTLLDAHKQAGTETTKQGFPGDQAVHPSSSNTRRLPRQALEVVGNNSSEPPDEKPTALELLGLSWLDTNVSSHDVEPIRVPLNEAVEFAPAVVPSLRSEELRRSVISRDPHLRAKLQELHQEMQTMQRTNQGHDSQPCEQCEDKFDTIRKIRRGNTRRRIDEFEAL